MLALWPVFSVLSQGEALQLRHELSSNASHLYFLDQLHLIRATVWLMVVLVVVGAACWYFRGCFDRPRQETPIVVVPHNPFP